MLDIAPYQDMWSEAVAEHGVHAPSMLHFANKEIEALRADRDRLLSDLQVLRTVSGIAASSSYRVMSWRPIDGAPRDGSLVIVCREGEDESVGEACWIDGKWHTWDGENPDATFYMDDYLTHWMPKPKSFNSPNVP